MSSLRYLRRVMVQQGTNAPIDLSQEWQREGGCEAGDTFREGPEILAAEEFERHEALQLTEPFGERRVRPSGSCVVQGLWSPNKHGRVRSRDTFWEGYQVGARLKVEHFETFQLTEPFGERRVRVT